MQESAAAVTRAMVVLLRARARELGLTQAELAARSGISQPRISRVFAHTVVLTFPAAVALCDALDLELGAAYRQACDMARCPG